MDKEVSLYGYCPLLENWDTHHTNPQSNEHCRVVPSEAPRDLVAILGTGGSTGDIKNILHGISARSPLATLSDN